MVGSSGTRRELIGTFACLLAATAAVHGEGIQIAVTTSGGEFAVADLKVSGIGSGRVSLRTGQGPLVLAPSEVRPRPDGFFVTGTGDSPVLLTLMGGLFTDLENFELRLVAALRGEETLPAVRTVSLEQPSSGPAAPFDPTLGLAARPKAGNRSGNRRERPRPSPSRGDDAARDAGGPKFTVLATAEGLIGGRTATGMIIQKWTEGCALPDRSALNRRTRVVYKKNGRSSGAPVHDVGPWNTRDPYWRKSGGRPQAESGRDLTGRRTNRAGIDLMNGTWYKLLGLRSYDKRLIESTTGTVTWWFE